MMESIAEQARRLAAHAERMNLGDYVVDMISGFAGVVTARTVYLNGNVKVCVEACELDQGKPITEVWLDEHRCAKMPRPQTRQAGITHKEERT